MLIACRGLTIGPVKLEKSMSSKGSALQSNTPPMFCEVCVVCMVCECGGGGVDGRHYSGVGGTVPDMLRALLRVSVSNYRRIQSPELPSRARSTQIRYISITDLYPHR